MLEVDGQVDGLTGAELGGIREQVGEDLLDAQTVPAPDDWDIGADASLMHVQSAHSRDYGLGASVGRRLATNVWMAVGYNLLGFKDYDFSGASYRARGVYLTIRAKVDEDTFGLNRSHAAATP